MDITSLYSRDILQDLARDLFQTLLECYLDFLLKEDNCEVQLSQECSLQMLYDFRFVSAILCPSNLESQVCNDHGYYPTVMVDN